MKKSCSRSRSKSRKGASHSQQQPIVEEKKVRNTSYTQGDIIPDNIDDILMQISLKKPKRAYNYYIMEMMEKEKLVSLMDASKIYSKKWPKLPSSERKKFEQLAEADVERYQSHLDLVKKHILKKPLKEGATAYRIFLDDFVRKAIEKEEDVKEAKKAASEAWKEMPAEKKKEWEEKRKEHEAFYENLKKSTGHCNSYTLFYRDQMAAAREKEDTTMSMAQCAEKWKKTKQSVKDKYIEYAEQENEDRVKQRDLYEIAFGVKPRRPHGAYNFFLMEMAKEKKLNNLSDGLKLWKKTSEEEKEKYQKMAQREKLAYMVKKMEYDSAIKKTSTVKAMSPFNLFVADQKGKVDTSKMEKGGFFNHCYKKWSKMEDAGKRKYVQLSNEEKVEAEKMKEEFRARVHDKPRRPGNYYTIYIKLATPALRKQNPNKDAPEIMTMAAEQWKGMSEKQKDKYMKLYEEEVESYNSKIKEFDEKGYYTREADPDVPTPRSNKKTKNTQPRSSSKDKRGKKASKD